MNTSSIDEKRIQKHRREKITSSTSTSTMPDVRPRTERVKELISTVYNAEPVCCEKHQQVVSRTHKSETAVTMTGTFANN